MAIQLRNNETIITDAKVHWSAQFSARAWGCITILALIGQIASGVKGGPLIFTFLLGIIPVIYQWIKFSSVSYTLTNQRLYIENGILAKSKVDIPLNKINDVSFQQGIFQRIFGSGNIKVLTGNDQPHQLNHLDQPELFREKLSQSCNAKAA